MSGLASAVTAYNRAAAELDIARRLLHRAIDQDRRELGPSGRGDARCGTPSQYRIHLERGEQCPACTEAHRRDTQQRKRRNST